MPRRRNVKFSEHEREKTHERQDRKRSLMSRRRLQQRPGLLEVSRVKPLGAPAVDLGEQWAGGIPLALVLPSAPP